MTTGVTGGVTVTGADTDGTATPDEVIASAEVDCKLTRFEEETWPAEWLVDVRLRLVGWANVRSDWQFGRRTTGTDGT